MAHPEPPRLPDFFVAGAPKAGTTSLHRWLAQHPQVYMSPVKEPTFFGAGDLLQEPWFRERQERDRPALRAYLAGPMVSPAPLYVTEWDDYVALFRNAGSALAVGESSGGYMLLPGAAQTIRSAVPHARLVFVLRDPADALFSWYVLSLGEAHGLSFRDWIEAKRRSGRALSPLDAGRYATHLRRFHESFPPEQIQVHLFEDLRADPAALLRKVLAFIGVDPTVRLDTSVRHNPTTEPRWPRLHRLRRRLAGDGPLLRWLPATLRDAVARAYRRPRPRMDPEDRRLAVALHREEILATADLLGRDLSHWLE